MLTRDFQASILTERGDLVFLGPNLQYFSNSHSLSISASSSTARNGRASAPATCTCRTTRTSARRTSPTRRSSTPVFVGDELFCWVANTLHYADVGGSTAGSFCLDAIDTFQEPLSWPPVKLIDGGEMRDDVFELFARQSRLPGASQMDMRAAIAGNETTRAKILKLVERYGADVVKTVMRSTIDASEALFVERLQSIPDGHLEPPRLHRVGGPRRRRGLHVPDQHAKAGRQARSSTTTAPSRRPARSTSRFAAWSGAVLAAITQSMTSDLAGAYGGVYRRVEFRPSAGLLNCAEFPARGQPVGRDHHRDAAAHGGLGRRRRCSPAATRRRAS